MKKTLLLFLFLKFIVVQSQITTPEVRGNFGVEADLSSNYFNNAVSDSVDDWFSNGHAGGGDFIIDTMGAAAILAGYNSNPATRSMSFSRLMRQSPYAVVNNRLLLDAVFHRDFHGNDSTVFASGSNKNGMSPVSWNCPISQGIPDKNDILDAFTHVRRAGPNVTDSLWMFAGISIENTTGSRYFDFELYQTDFAYNRTTQQFTGYGPDAGHTTWKFDALGNVITSGDIIFTAEFSSSSITLVEARIWVNKQSLNIIPTTFKWGGDFDGDGAHATYGYANILPKTNGDFYTGIQNTIATWAGPFSLVRVNNDVVTNYLPRQFMEFSINLTKLGIEPASFSSNACGTPFRRVLIKSRSSTSFTAELKDFIGPFKMFDYPKVDAGTALQYYCGASMPVTALNVVNPIGTSIYTWNTPDGNIVGATSGVSINVDKPGTYYVTHQLHSQCPVFAMDTLSIYFDATCTVLDFSIRQFNARQVGQEVELNWVLTNNEAAAQCDLEYSEDNRVFKFLTQISTNDQNGIAEYRFRCLPFAKTPFVFYRLKIKGKTGSVKYSEVVKSISLNSLANAARIFPNPAQSGASLILESNENTTMDIDLFESTGRFINTARVQVTIGKNVLPLNALPSLLPGIYFLKIKDSKKNIRHLLKFTIASSTR